MRTPSQDHLHHICGLVFCFLWRNYDIVPPKNPDRLEHREDVREV